MAMYLGGVPVFAIQMIGRWSSDSFMKYIRKQIEEFTFDISNKMLTMQSFRHLPPHTTTSAGNGTEYGGSASLMIGQDESGGRHQLAQQPIPEGTGGGETSYY